MKTLIIISTGRCGTKRISEILQQKLETKGVAVSHQRPLSRLCNVLGHVMMLSAQIEWIKEFLFHYQLKNGLNGSVIVDPLTSTCIPDSFVKKKDVHLLHLYRSNEGFATSMFRLTRRKRSSWIAHNFIPFWQPGLYLLENALNRGAEYKYAMISERKNAFFSERYGSLPNYHKLSRRECFQGDHLSVLIQKVFNITISLSEEELKIKSNQSS